MNTASIVWFGAPANAGLCFAAQAARPYAQKPPNHPQSERLV
jgi:hypothetical protein